MNSRDSESDSPPSTRMSSHSPESTAVRLEDGAWDQTIVMNDSDVTDSSPPASYAISAPLASKPLQFNPYPSTSSRSSSMTTPLYMNSQSGYSQPADRSMNGNSYASPNFTSMRIPSREDRTTHYSYASSQYDNSIQNAPAPASLHLRDFPSRRSLTEPTYTLDSGFPHLPPVHHAIRLPSPPRLQDSRDHLPTPRSIYSAISDGRA